MPNGTMLAEMEKILGGSDTVPQNVTNRMILAAMVEFSGRLTEVLNRVSALESRPVKDCEICKREIISNIAKESEREHAKFISFPYLWEHYGEKILWLLIAAAIGAVLARIF